MKSILSPIVLVALALPALATITMDWVNIGNPGNAADPLTGRGSVNYEYQIGKYEVTNAQYGSFLNAKGSSNSGGIYNVNMANFGVSQNGVSGNFTYYVSDVFANHPVSYVSWFDAARFANWMMNGGGGSDMETGAYTLNGATTGAITANIGALVYIPTENEWYKAAYYSSANSNYSLYPNGQNTITMEDANYNSSFGAFSTHVGAYSNDPSSYGTFDQGGNVWEWNDDVVSSSLRKTRGGAWNKYGGYHGGYLLSSFSLDSPSSNETYDKGFRVASTVGFASAVPEPTLMLLTMVAGGMMLIRRKR